MIIQGALFLLVAIVVLGMVGKWLNPAARGRTRDPLIRSAERCGTCGDYVVGRADACRRSDCPNR